MKRTTIFVAYSFFLTSACYDFSLPSRDSGANDSDIADAVVGITTPEGNFGGTNSAKTNDPFAGSLDSGALTGFDGGPTNAGCDLTSCPNGCCSKSGCVLFKDQSKTQCGAAGSVCKTCDEGQTCGTNGTCICNPTSCPNGCCSDNKCVPRANQSNKVCGAKGNACLECDSGEACDKGTCSCGGTSCAGCCSKGQCVEPSNETCGIGGGNCVSCLSGQGCNAQGKCVCDKSSCPSGCCDANGKCQTPSITTCNVGGEPCLACSFPKATASCTGGRCSITSCNTGYGDCNEDVSDGCETNLLTNSSHCSDCLKGCTASDHASKPSCDNGTCKYTCDPGYTGSANCFPIDCGTPNTVHDKSSVKLSQGTTYDSQATYSCANGWTIDTTNGGTNPRTCGQDKKWSGTAPSCKEDGFCGDGIRQTTEDCDPKAAVFSAFNCSALCKRISLYTPCNNTSGADPLCVGGTTCTNLNTCGRTCSGISDCDAVPGYPNLDVQCPIPRGTYCIVRCNQNEDCPPGTTCNGGQACEGP